MSKVRTDPILFSRRRLSVLAVLAVVSAVVRSEVLAAARRATKSKRLLEERAYDQIEGGNVIQTHEHKADFKEW